jgi:hypothetical protein
MLSISEFEKLIKIDRDQEIIDMRNRILPNIEKTEKKKFFTTYRYKNFHFLISSYLSDKEKINFLYLNRFTVTNLKKIFDESGYKKLKDDLMRLHKKGITFNNLIQNNAQILLKNLKILNNYPKSDEFYSAVNLLGKWMNKLYFENKVNKDSDGNPVYNEIYFVSPINQNLGTYGILFLLFTISHNSTIEAIDLSNSALNEKSLKYLKFALKKEKPIYSLNLENNIISDGMIHVVTCFEKLKNVKYLNLSEIHMNKTNAELCASHLNELSKLEVIILDNNSIKSSGARDLLYSLLNLKNLKNLSFRNTDIDEEFAGSLGTFLKEKNIELIDLSENKYLNRGFAKKFAYFLPDVKLKFLNLGNCALTVTDLEFILDGFESNANFTILNLNGNDSSPNISKKIKEIVDTGIIDKKVYYEGKRFSAKKCKLKK